MKGINLKEAKYFMDRIAKNDLGYLRMREHEVFDRMLDNVEACAKYKEVGEEITEYAKQAMEQMKGEVDSIREEMNKIAEEFKAIKEWIAEWEEANEEQKAKMDELNKAYKEKWDALDKLYMDANTNLDEYRNNKIEEEYKDIVLFELSDEDYETIDSVIKRTLILNHNTNTNEDK